MPGTPQTWHYGLIARWWAEFNTTGPEIEYFRSLIERYGQPALDVGCGTGRLLLPYVRAGLDVDGCDISPDMLALCREQAEREGLTMRLYAQAMHELDLPRTYRTVYICGSFGLGGNRGWDQETLRRIYHALEPGGVLAFDHYLPYRGTAHWRYWTKEGRAALPEEWPASGQRRQASDGAEYELRTRLLDLDPLEQRLTLQMRAAMWRDGQFVAEEERSLQSNLYFKLEILLMLEQAGFRDLRVYTAYTETRPTADDAVLVFIATK
jgi:SAM-dependent methyltransferase